MNGHLDYHAIWQGPLAEEAGGRHAVNGDEIAPEPHRQGCQAHPPLALLSGFNVMMFPNATLD